MTAPPQTSAPFAPCSPVSPSKPFSTACNPKTARAIDSPECEFSVSRSVALSSPRARRRFRLARVSRARAAPSPTALAHPNDHVLTFKMLARARSHPRARHARSMDGIFRIFHPSVPLPLRPLLARVRVDASSRASLSHLLSHARVRRRRGRREQVAELHDARPRLSRDASRSARDGRRSRARGRDNNPRWGVCTVCTYRMSEYMDMAVRGGYLMGRESARGISRGSGGARAWTDVCVSFITKSTRAGRRSMGSDRLLMAGS